MSFVKALGLTNTAAGFLARSRTFRRRRRKFARSFPTANKIASYAAQVPGLRNTVNVIRGMINCEKHYSDSAFSSTVTIPGQVQIVSNIAQGDDVTTRTGQSILHKYLVGTWSMVLNASDTNCFVRMILFTDTSNQGSTPAVTDVLETASIFSNKRIDNQPRFAILKDMKVALNSQGRSAVFGRIYKKTNFHVKYTGSLDTDTGKNNIYMLMISTDTTNPPTVQWNIRNAFYDN